MGQVRVFDKRHLERRRIQPNTPTSTLPQQILKNPHIQVIMLGIIMDILQCPACQGDLDWQIAERRGDQIEAAEARCTACAAIYPVQEGIGVFLTPGLPRKDLWEQVDNQLSQYLSQQPEIERRLMEVPLQALSPADRFFRAMVLEERGALIQARAIYEGVIHDLYTAEYLICQESQIHFLLDHLSGSEEPIVDLASGRGDLVQAMLQQVSRPVVATDFSLRVLRRDRHWFEFFGWYDRLSLLAFDARLTPFKDGAIRTMTTHLGLSNLQDPGTLLVELRRVVSGEFLAISSFYPEDDRANTRAISELGLSDLLFHSRLRKIFTAAGWKLQPVNVCQGRALPTPASRIFVGTGIDALPVTETMLEWGTLVAT